MEDKELVQFTLKDGSKILVEVEKYQTGGLKPIAREPGQIAAKAKETFEDAMANLQPMITAIKEKIDTINELADEVEVKFGVKLTSEVGAILASVGGEVNYEITLKWQKKS